MQEMQDILNIEYVVLHILSYYLLQIQSLYNIYEGEKNPDIYNGNSSSGSD